MTHRRSTIDPKVSVVYNGYTRAQVPQVLRLIETHYPHVRWNGGQFPTAYCPSDLGDGTCIRVDGERQTLSWNSSPTSLYCGNTKPWTNLLAPMLNIREELTS